MTPINKHVTAQTVSDFAEMASDGNPTPGGGAVAGVVAALAASLVGMAGRFALNHLGDLAQHRALVRRADELRLRCCELAEADTRAYAAYAAAQQTPADNGGYVRRSAMAAARKEAAGPPSELASAARELAEIGLELVRFGNPHLRSDACAAALFASAAAQAAAMFVGVNTLKDEPRRQLNEAYRSAAAANLAAHRAAEAVGLPGPVVAQ